MLAIEVVCHADIKIPGILLVWAAFEYTFNDFPLIDYQSVLKVKHSLLPVSMPGPASCAISLPIMF